MSTENQGMNSDVTASESRALHRVVRAMHDGNCPKCGLLAASDTFVCGDGHRCTRCAFGITEDEATAALETFRPFMELNVAAFETWRANRAPTVIRNQWMRILGMGEDEIREHNRNDPATDVVEEQEQLDAAIRLNSHQAKLRTEMCDEPLTAADLYDDLG